MTPLSRHVLATLVASLGTCGVSACSRVDATIEPPTPGWQRMLTQPRYDAQGRSHYFDNGAVMRVPPAGSVPYRDTGPASDEAPEVVDRALLARGRDRYEVFCATCHGLDGYAETPVAANMSLRPPPSLHAKRSRGYDTDGIVSLIEEGYGLMPSYAARLDARDRRAVAAWVKVLQLSQHAEVATLPSALVDRLEEETR